MSKLVRLSDEAYSKLSIIAQKTGLSRQDIIDNALKQFERDDLLKRANDAYAAMNKSEKTRRNAEISEWDATLEDGLKNG